ncbi:MAG: hypothetical protein ACOX5R_05490 [bacterium]
MTFISDESVADQLADAAPLDGFRNVTADYIIQAVSSGLDKIDNGRLFRPFNGRWYGLRNNRVIGQEWHATETWNPARSTNHPTIHLRTAQYVWTGDGFRWHFIVNNDKQKSEEFVLGIKYHAKSHDFSDISDSIPMVGVFVDFGRVIWISPSHVLFEEISLQTPSDYCYSSTEILYTFVGNLLKINDLCSQLIHTQQKSSQPSSVQFQYFLPE